MAETHQSPTLATSGVTTSAGDGLHSTTRKAGVVNRKQQQAAQPQDGFREIVEMIAFVVVLVLLLKSFVAEAFVIPTGSMATTLWGYQKVVQCAQCKYEFPVNCSDEYERKPPVLTTGATCPNCRYDIDFATEKINPATNSGDRVLVAKCLYDTGLLKPKPFDVVVFKPPKEPQVNFEPRNYIKRLIGLPEQTIGIWYGDLYRLPGDKGPVYDDSNVPLENRWTKEPNTHENDAVGLLRQENSPFEILRKPPDQIIAMRRIVFDNDFQPKDRNAPEVLRWKSDGSTWTPVEDNKNFISTTKPDSTAWLRYRNILRDGPSAQLITDFMGYNTKTSNDHGANRDHASSQSGQNWVGDLMVECDVTVDQPEGTLVLELSKGVDRFHARWNLQNGECRLVRLSGTKEIELSKQSTALSKPGTFRVRFANFDERLTVWVDGKLPFDEGVTYSAPAQRGPTENDLLPAGIGVQGAAVTVKKLKLWRDTYYTVSAGNPSDLSVRLYESPDQSSGPLARRADADVAAARELLQKSNGSYQLLSNPDKWNVLRDLPCETMYVQPGHYLCLGDNSASSLDGRQFGLVPDRLMQGRAMLVYWPFNLGVWPFNPPENRFGPIR